MNFGLTGNPLGHSFSKVIHEELFKIKNVDNIHNFIVDNMKSELSENKPFQDKMLKLI